MAVGKPVMNLAAKTKAKAEEKQQKHYVVSDCALAADHLVQGLREAEKGEGRAVSSRLTQYVIEKGKEETDDKPLHPIELLALAYRT
ncbi:MAG: hypothetical protein JSR72_23465 [Proteobacteria bacterium]|nr:hypothetical protein [Pseudomonadota bacterium]